GVVNLRVTWPEPQRLPTARLRLRRPAEVIQRGAEHAVSLRVIWPKPQSLAEAHFRFCRPAEGTQRSAELVVRLGEIWAEPQGLPIARLRLCRPAEGVQRVAEVVVSVANVGVVQAETAQGIADIAVVVWTDAMQRDRLADVVDRLVIVSDLKRRDAQQM